LIILMIPTQVGLLYEFYSRPAFAKISREEISALKFIKENTSEKDVILTPPYNQYLNLGGVTPNIWDWFDTSYVSALSSRRTYMDDYEQNDIMGYVWRGRLTIKENLFKEPDPNIFQVEINETGAQILYFPKAVRPIIDLTKTGLTKIFENSEIEVWKINQNKYSLLP